ncbi:hypothetical protein MED15_01175 [Micromonospora noduli]|uniref:Uncharacterized protein n=1 Tax=Micromonospora noduli TaxID=709876 RepID=A0ABX9D652_9ACTN|nr:hypothetical protein [Micromonospora noduli]RAO23335.1 hypothetical protein MED15_01175 [Micromonospora noduli]
MIPQTYELWVAETFGDGESPIVGRVIAWHIPKPEEDVEGERGVPIYVYSSAGSPSATAWASPRQWFLGATADEAREAAESHQARDPKEQQARRDRQKREKAREWLASCDAARSRAAAGDFSAARDLTAERMRGLLPRVADLLRTASWHRVEENVVQISVKATDASLEYQRSWDQLTHTVAQEVLGEAWTIDVRQDKPGLFDRMR